MNPIIPAAINAGTSLFGAFTSFGQQQKANQFNVDMWKRQNEYNAPKAQMARLKEAGLNPNLIYGTGANGASGNAASAPTFEKLSDAAYQPLNINSAMESLQSFTDWDIKKATSDNLRARTQMETQNALLKTAETAGRILTNKKLTAELPYAEELAKTSLEAAQANVKKTQADTKYTLNQDERAQLSNDANLRESAERILTSRLGRQQTAIIMQNQRYEGEIKKLDAELAKKGIRPQDPFYVSIVERLITKIEESLDKKNPDENLPWFLRIFK